MVREDAAIMPQSFEGMLAQADVLVKSGLLPAAIKTAAAAVTVMLTGRELGLGPMQSFRSIFVVNGKPSLSAQLMGGLIWREGHSYKINESTNARCEIEFRRKGGTSYTHEFTMDDAKRAGLEKSATWQAYPKAMLFSRCMSAGARVTVPDVLAGMYTPEELADPDTLVIDEGGEVIDVKAKPVLPPEPERAALPEPAKPAAEAKPAPKTARDRPYDADTIRKALRQAADKLYAGLASEAQQHLAVAGVEKLFKADTGEVQTQKRHSLLLYLFDTDTSKTLTAGQASTLIDWATVKVEQDGKVYYNPSEHAPAEAAAIVAAYEVARGQQALAI